MKNRFICCLALSMMAVVAMADDVMTKSKDTVVVNTTSLCEAKGYKSATPLKVYFLKNKIVKIVPLKNMETKKFFAKVEQGLIPKIVGMKVDKAKKMLTPSYDGVSGATPGVDAGNRKSQQTIDGVTGATLSSNAVKRNVYSAIDYYSKHKR